MIFNHSYTISEFVKRKYLTILKEARLCLQKYYKRESMAWHGKARLL